ncbi:F11 receptor, tandem duplicate 1 [Triplophysa dalaica]|uniref:F11 receptor, tandem duplicate 1 n=1 Tax=Triplophysa dalaica TaxID=1582913 RepID=UPI0024DFC103|nr:F11 receptor, tandem duplicate 1 [Triplophysa dalaica]
MLTFAFVFLSIAATGLCQFWVDVVNPAIKVKENEGVDMQCKYSASFGSAPRVEWKFKDIKGSQSFVYFDGKPTDKYNGRITVYEGGLRLNKVTRADTGDYDCEVFGNSGYAEKTVKLTVLVPPTKPVSRIPQSVTTGSNALLTCVDLVGSPPPTYKWYKNGSPLPEDPSKFPNFKNLTYKMNTFNGNLEFPSISKMDIGSYYCEAVNSEGAMRGDAVQMDVRDVNVGGIVAGVIVALLAVGLLLFGLWYANKKGFLPKVAESKPKTAVYTHPRTEDLDDGDGEFRQKSSFVV